MSDRGEREAASRELAQVLRGLAQVLRGLRKDVGALDAWRIMEQPLDAADRARAETQRYREMLVQVRGILGASTPATVLANASVAFTLADNALKNQSGGDDGNQTES